MFGSKYLKPPRVINIGTAVSFFLTCIYSNAHQTELEMRMQNADRTLIHVIAGDAVETWRQAFYDEYKKVGRPSRDWVHAFGGLWFSSMPKTSIADQASYYKSNGVLRYAYWQSRADQPDPIILIANETPDTVWFNATYNNLNVWKKWELENRNKTNDFPELLIDYLKKQELPYHAQFYRDYKLAGYLMPSMEGTSFVLLDPDYLAETKLFVPSGKYAPDPVEIIYKPGAIAHLCRSLLGE